MSIFKSKLIPDRREIAELFRSQRNAEAPVKTVLWLLALITPFGVAGALYGYSRAYNKFLKQAGYYPTFQFIPSIVRFSMFMFGLISFILAHLFILLIYGIITVIAGRGAPSVFLVLLIPVLFNLVLVSFAFAAFKKLARRHQ